MIRTIYTSDASTDRNQLRELIALARKSQTPIETLIGKTILIVIDPTASDKEIFEIFSKESAAYIERSKIWFEHRYIMKPRKSGK